MLSVLGDYELKGKVIDQKSNQWFGATLYSAGHGPIVACASRYVWYSTHKYERRDPVGTCYIARNYFSDFSEYSPCRTAQWGYHRQGSCQAGFSAAISKDGNNLFMGAPGNCYWQGRMYSIDATSKYPYKPSLFAPFGTGKVVSQSLVSRPASFHTIDGPATDDDSYLGYSVAVGNFTGEAQEGIAAGMPRGGGLLGKILLYTWNLTNFMNITGRQMGSYFGYAVAAADVDGDHYDDLVIGAPLFTEPNNEGKYEVGKVYVVYQRSKQGTFKKLDELDGTNSKSRFGLSLTSLGDINLDGYTDFAVGAPYDGIHGRGAVYIFHGSKNGVQRKYTQVIYAEEVGTPPPSTFGFSLAGGLDLDQNAYPDTIIGSYLSDVAYFLRSKPVVKVTGYAQFQTLDKEIALEDKHCFIRGNDGRLPVACTVIDTCLNYTGVGVPKEISLQLHFTLDTQKKKDIRMFFLDGETPLSNTWNETWRLSKDSRSRCNKRTVYIKNDIRDKLTPLDVEVTYAMDTQHYYTDLPAVLDLTSKSLKKDSISVRKNCGADNICVPDLALEVKPNVERYLLASNEVLYFDITVSNNNEDSFETTFSVQIPEDVNFTKVEDSGDVKITCREISINYTIVCDIGNPLPAQKIVSFKMFFKPHYKEGMKRFYVFNMQVDSANPEDPRTSENNKRKIELPIWVNSRLELKGASRPSELHYNWSYYAEREQVKHEREIGPQVIHLYTITNNGPSAINEAEVLIFWPYATTSAINEAEVLIFWPYATTSGDDLMYLLEPPHILGNVRCEGADFNYQGYFVERRNKTIWETFDIDVSKEVTSVTTVVTKTQGGVVIEENEKKFSASSEDSRFSSSSETNNDSNDKFEKATGDASEILKEREEQRGRGTETTIGAHSTLLTSGQESKLTKAESFTNSSRGPGGTIYTYTKNTTISFGPHGEVIRNETSYYGNKQNLGRSNGQLNAQEERREVRNHPTSGRSSVRLTTDEVYEPPYSSVEYEVAQPNGYDRSISSHNQHQNRYGDSTQQPRGAQHVSYGQGTGHYEGSQYHNPQHRKQDLDDQIGHKQYSGHYQGFNHEPGEQNELGHASHSYIYNKSYNTNSGQPMINAANFGHEGKVQLLDLGVIGNNDQSLLNKHRDTQLTDHNTQHGRYDPDLDRIVYDRPHHQTGYSSRQFSEGTAAHYGSGENQNYLNSGKTHHTSHSESKWSHSASHGKKRQTKGDYDLKKEAACKATKCKFIKCYVGPMRKDEDATIAIRTRINATTLKNISSAHNITFSTMMVGKITNVPFIGIPSEKETVKYEIGTKVIAPESPTKPDMVPLWVVVLSAVAGALILLLLIFLFYKCGFFKRNRPSNVCVF
ncbi:Integrin alpha [Popillia japonica]|uniref:Integrin alpha n=1 Tax=Popillia japonica TaxID=7064 RepID=A0AAW1JCS3_POPJA